MDIKRSGSQPYVVLIINTPPKGFDLIQSGEAHYT